jgi:putative ABC transport system permease protein
MNFVALKMLTGDRAKYLGLVFTIAFCTFLLENQSSIFAGILNRTGSQIADVTDADIWVMDRPFGRRGQQQPPRSRSLARAIHCRSG